VVRAAEEHRLAPEQHAALARREHLLDHVARLVLVVRDGDVDRFFAFLLLRKKLFSVLA